MSRTPGRRRSGRLGAAWLLAVWTTVAASATASTGDLVPGPISASHQPLVAEVVAVLREAQAAAARAVAAGDLEAVHESEAEIDDALHALEGAVDAVPESGRGRAGQLLAGLFGVVDGLHEAAEAADRAGLEQLVRHLGDLIDEILPAFLGSDADDGRTSARGLRSNEPRGKEDSR